MMKETAFQKPNAFTFRAFAVGTVASFIIGVGTTYNIMVLHGSYMAIDFSAAAAIFLFFLLTFIVNTAFGKVKSNFALNSSELKTVYVMMVVACAIPTMGMSAQLLPIITSPFYYALPENSWAELIQPHIKPWLVPQGKLWIKYFYEGLPSWEGRMPWGIWIKPLLVWGSFLMVLYFVMICMMVILRKQWMEKERLVYPLAQLPLEMSRLEGKSILSPLFKNRIMWIGFAIAFGISSLNGLHYYYPVVPGVQLVQYISIFRRTTTLVFRLSLPMVGFFYMVHLDVSFSLWFFNLLSLGVRGFMKYFGYHYTENLGIYGSPSPIFAHQGMGAIAVLVISGLWVGREHLKQVIKKAFTNDPNIDDSGEAISYRVAFWGMLIGLIYMTFWLNATGIPLWIVPIFLLATFLIFIGLTRIVVESGMAEAVASTIGSSFVISGIGARPLGPEGLTAMALTYVWSSDIRTFVMASAANGLKVAELGSNRKRPLFWAMMLAIIVCAVSSIWMLLRVSYLYGGINGNSWFYGGGAKAPYNYIITQIMNPAEANITGWYIKGIGAGIMTLLMFLRQRFLWWPFHPIGFAIGPIWMMDQMWFTVFLAWIIKSAILKYGGLKLYRTLLPLFLGLILGQFVCNGTWLILDFITGHRGNMIFWI